MAERLEHGLAGLALVQKTHKDLSPSSNASKSFLLH